MDIHDIRELNYKTLMAQYAGRLRDTTGSDYGVLDKFGKFCDVSPRYLSHVNMGRKKLGDDTCRKMEAAFGHPHGWMDTNRATVDSSPSNAPEQSFLAMALKMYRIDPVATQAMMMKFMMDSMGKK